MSVMGNNVHANLRALMDPPSSLASATTLVIPDDKANFLLTGTALIGTIRSSSIQPGRVIRLSQNYAASMATVTGKVTPSAVGQIYGLSSADGTFSWGTNGTLALQQDASGYWRPIETAGITFTGG